jgi:hypothetical protein
MNLSRVLPLFSIVFLIVYAIAMYFNLAPFSYYPQVGKFVAGVGPTTQQLGPSMYWYGWLSVALVIAVPIAAIAGFASDKVINRIAPIAPWLAIALAVFFVWVLRAWFTH